MTPIVATDYYKTEHIFMMPKGTCTIYSNFTPRKSRMPGVNAVVFFGLQAFIKKFLIKKFNQDFFSKPLEEVIEEYSFAIKTPTEQIAKLHKLGYLPIVIKALPEGSLCPIGVPCFTVRNTHHDFAWLTNYLETIISCELWQAITSATIAREYYKLLSKYALESTGSDGDVQWQGHDFSMRGMSSLDSAISSGMAHLTSFTGTDTIPAIYALKNYYNATGLIGASVPATEHSVMCMGTKEAEIDTFRRLLGLYPEGFLSVVSDTWNLWTVVGPKGYCAQLKEEILSRNGRLVIRPDSGDPVYIVCGYRDDEVVAVQGADRSIVGYTVKATGKIISVEEKAGVVELLYNIFGGTQIKGNDGKSYKVLDSHIGVIYGDSITLDRAKAICERLMAKGFASTNVVLGIGSYTYQYNTRDTFGFAMKATYGEVKEQKFLPLDHPDWNPQDDLGTIVIKPREIFKAPITDDGTKKSAKGLLQVYETPSGYKLKDQCTWDEEQKGALQVVFFNGQLVRETSLDEIRERLKN